MTLRLTSLPGCRKMERFFAGAPMAEARARVRPWSALLLACTLSCGGDSPTAPADTELLAAPSQVVLTDSQTVDTVYLSAKPQGISLEWKLASKPDWLTVSPSSGTIRSDIVTITVSAPQLATMEPGQLFGRLEFIANGGTASVPVGAVVQPNPVVRLSSATVTIPETTDTARVTLTNAGRGALNWSATSSAAGLTCSPGSGTLATGASTVLTLVAKKGPMPVGTAKVNVTIKSNQRAGDVTLPVSIVVPAAPVATLSTARLVFPAGVTSRTLWLRNPGKGDLHWSATAPSGWGAVTPGSGTLTVGDSALLTVAVDRAAAGSTDVSGNLDIASDALNGPVSALVEVTSAAGLSLGLTVLDYRVVDAEYSASAGIIATVSDNPAKLTVIDVESGRTSSVALALPPGCVALEPDGRYAAVCHNGYMSYVNLLTMQVERTYAVTTDALDAVLPGNGWLYVFPRHDQWESIRNINLSTGVETRAGTIYAGALGRLNRAGTAIYVPTMGLSPSSVDKYSITNGVVQSLWSSPYWGEHSYGNLWLSEDGGRIYAASGEVFWTADVRGQDMSYAGALAGSGTVFGATDSRERGRAYVVSNDNSHGLRVYDTQYLAFRGVVPLPQFTGGSGPISAQGYFVFANPAGDRVYVLERADPSGGLAHDWGLAVLDAGALP